MHISDIFKKLGIKGFDDLKADEKKVYEASGSAEEPGIEGSGCSVETVSIYGPMTFFPYVESTRTPREGNHGTHN